MPTIGSGREKGKIFHEWSSVCEQCLDFFYFLRDSFFHRYRSSGLCRSWSAETEGYMLELISSAMHSTAQGFVGVSCIFIYFAVMLWAIVYRVKRGEHVH